MIVATAARHCSKVSAIATRAAQRVAGARRPPELSSRSVPTVCGASSVIVTGGRSRGVDYGPRADGRWADPAVQSPALLRAAAATAADQEETE